MAKQGGPILWVKTFGCVSFYVRLGVGCVRMKSNLTGKRWRSDPAFAGSRRSAACMALSSKLGSIFYRTIPQQHRVYAHYKKLVGVAQHMLCKGYNLRQVNKVLNFTVHRFLRKLNAADPSYKPLRSPFAAMLSLSAKPAFTAVATHQSEVLLFTVSTFSEPATRQCLEAIPPRGSPAMTNGCDHKITKLYQPLPALSKPRAVFPQQPSTMAGLTMPISTQITALC